MATETRKRRNYTEEFRRDAVAQRIPSRIKGESEQVYCTSEGQVVAGCLFASKYDPLIAPKNVPQKKTTPVYVSRINALGMDRSEPNVNICIYWIKFLCKFTYHNLCI
jgi:hypothetical protein